jgi:hypothetical protein
MSTKFKSLDIRLVVETSIADIMKAVVKVEESQY